jgi:hypothetical protein
MISPPVGHKLTPRTSPFHVYQLVLQLLKLTFKDISEDPNYPFRLTDDPETTGVFVAATMDKNTKMYGAKPVILVSRGAMSTQQLVIGDRAQAALGLAESKGSTGVHSSVDISVISKHPTTTDIIATEVFGFLTSCRTILPALVSLHQITGISASPVAPYEDDDHMYQVQLSLNYFMQYKWTKTLSERVLAEIGLYINDIHRLDLTE